MGGQFWKYYQENGMNDTALAEALKKAGHSDKFSMFKQVMDGVYDSFKDFDPISQQELKNRFIEGVYDGAIYNRQVSPQQNLNFESDAARDTRLFNKEMAQNQDRRAQEQHDAQMAIAGATRNANGTWDASTVINPYGKTGSGNGSSSGGGSGSGGADGRMKRRKTKYMTGNDENWTNAVQKDGVHLDVNGKNSVQRGATVKFRKDGDRLYAMVNGTVIAKYDTLNKTLLDVDNHNNVLNVLGISGSPFKRNGSKYYWRKSDDKLLRRLCQEASDIINENGGNVNALNNYEFRFQSDGKDPREFLGRGNNGSIFIENLDEEMPSIYDVNPSGQNLMYPYPYPAQ